MSFSRTLATEFLKLRRSRVTWFSALAISLAPLALSLFMWIVREPGRAAQLGLLGTKANLAGLEATWSAFLSMLVLAVGIGGMLLLSFIVAYVFGREYAEGTAKNLLALPIGRHWFVLAKLTVVAVWWAALAVVVLAEAFALGSALALPGLAPALALGALRDVALVAVAAYLLATPVAWVAALGRGYLPPLAFAFGMLALGNIFSRTGWAAWFPWSVVPLFIGAVGQRQTEIAQASYAVVLATFVAGIAATVVQFRADNTQ